MNVYCNLVCTQSCRLNMKVFVGILDVPQIELLKHIQRNMNFAILGRSALLKAAAVHPDDTFSRGFP